MERGKEKKRKNMQMVQQEEDQVPSLHLSQASVINMVVVASQGGTGHFPPVTPLRYRTSSRKQTCCAILQLSRAPSQISQQSQQPGFCTDLSSRVFWKSHQDATQWVRDWTEMDLEKSQVHLSTVQVPGSNLLSEPQCLS